MPPPRPYRDVLGNRGSRGRTVLPVPRDRAISGAARNSQWIIGGFEPRRRRRRDRDAEGVEGCIGCGDGVSAFPSGGVWKGGHALHRFFFYFLAFKTTDFL